MDATVTANQEPRAMMKIEPPNRFAVTTMMIGIHVEVGIGPRNLMMGSTQYRILALYPQVIPGHKAQGHTDEISQKQQS